MSVDPLDPSVPPPFALWDTSRMPPAPDEVLKELERVLASPGFANAARLRRFLKFVVDQALAGNGERLKEYVIGVEVFDRDPQFDPRVDSIVRVEAGRVRSKLDEYYNGAGRDAAIAIRLPKGAYAPLFEAVSTPKAQRTNGNGAPLAVAPPAAAVPIPAAEAPAGARVSPASPGRKAGIAVAAALALLAAVAAAWFVTPSPPSPRPAIAVLPFTPYSPTDADRMLAERLTDAVTAELVRLDALAVVSSTTARAVAAERSANDVARDLAADYLLQARLLGEPGGLRVEMRLVDGSSNFKLAVETLRGDAADVDELARRVAAAAATELARRMAPDGAPLPR
jgi:TolB-like protein